MDILNLGAQLLQQKFGANINSDVIKDALTNLIGNSDGSLNLGGLVSSMMSNGGLQNAVSSWLGDGGNAEISAQQITDIFGADKLAGFASQLGIGESEAAGGLAEVMPQLVDKNSSGGSLLEQAGGLGGVLGMAKRFF